MELPLSESIEITSMQIPLVTLIEDVSSELKLYSPKIATENKFPQGWEPIVPRFTLPPDRILPIKSIEPTEPIGNNRTLYEHTFALIPFEEEVMNIAFIGKNHFPERHTVCLVKTKKNEILIIDPNNTNFSKELIKTFYTRLAASQGFRLVFLKGEKFKCFYKAPDQAIESTSSVTDARDDGKSKRDCIDIAVKLAFKMNEIQQIILLPTNPPQSSPSSSSSSAYVPSTSHQTPYLLAIDSLTKLSNVWKTNSFLSKDHNETVAKGFQSSDPRIREIMIRILWKYSIFRELKLKKTSDIWETDGDSLQRKYIESLKNNIKKADEPEFTRLLEKDTRGLLDFLTAFRKLRIRCSDSELQIKGEIPLEITTKSLKKRINC